jgi:hypothetical protein
MRQVLRRRNPTEAPPDATYGMWSPPEPDAWRGDLLLGEIISTLNVLGSSSEEVWEEVALVVGSSVIVGRAVNGPSWLTSQAESLRRDGASTNGCRTRPLQEWAEAMERLRSTYREDDDSDSVGYVHLRDVTVYGPRRFDTAFMRVRLDRVDAWTLGGDREGPAGP